MSEEHSFAQSVTLWLDKLKAGQPDALENLWDRYFRQLTRVARQKLGNVPRRVMDEEDIALDVLYSLGEGAADGKFEKLRNRDDLWKLLVAMTSRRVVDEIRKQTAQKRGTGDVRGDSILHRPESNLPAVFDQFLSTDPTPDFLVSLDEENQRMLSLLADDTQRKIAFCRMQGFTNQEIADKLDISLRTVERKLTLIRNCWETELESTG